jgi:hypothetical protein
VAAVLAEVAGVSEDRSFDVEAEAQASRMRGVRRDWAGRPCITWSVAAELLESLRAEQARVLAVIEERAIEKDQAFRASLPAGIPAGEVPAGMTPAGWMMASEPVPAGRVKVFEDALARGGSVYRPITPEPVDR